MPSLLAASSAYQAGQYAAMATMAVLLVALVARLRRQNRPPRARLTDAIAALVVAALLIGNVVRHGGEDKSDPWDTAQGSEMRAGFVDGCRSSTGGQVDCRCAFDRLTSKPPHDTPAGLATLAGPVAAAQQSEDPRDIPAVLLNAMQSCPASAG